METYGLLSLFPPLLTIGLAIATRHVYVSLLLGTFLGWTIITHGNVINGSFATIQGMADVFKNSNNTSIILFSCLIGVMITFIQRSGGVAGFIQQITQRFLDSQGVNTVRNKIKVQFYAFFTGVIIFIDTSISILTVGSLYRPLFDKVGICREKLAYIVDSTCSPVSILIPFNAWGAYIIGLLMIQGIENAIPVMLTAVVLNFYAIIAILIVLITIFTKRDMGPMKTAQARLQKTGQLISQHAELPGIVTQMIAIKKKEEIPSRAYNMLIPIFTMVVLMPFMLVYTGWHLVDTQQQLTAGEKLLSAFTKGSGAQAVLYAIIFTLLLSIILYTWQRLFSLHELTELTFKGLSGMLPLAALMVFAYALSNVCRALGTGEYVASIASEWLLPQLVPMVLFLISALVAFAIGTSWGTFAIMMAVAVPLAQVMDANLYLTVAAVLGGGIFGDHCSPISDTTILSSIISVTDHIDHVRTQLPYALLGGTITTLLYLLFGLLF